MTNNLVNSDSAVFAVSGFIPNVVELSLDLFDLCIKGGNSWARCTVPLQFDVVEFIYEICIVAVIKTVGARRAVPVATHI